MQRTLYFTLFMLHITYNTLHKLYNGKTATQTTEYIRT